VQVISKLVKLLWSAVVVYKVYKVYRVYKVHKVYLVHKVYKAIKVIKDVKVYRVLDLLGVATGVLPLNINLMMLFITTADHG